MQGLLLILRSTSRQVLKPGVLTHKGQFYGADRPVTLFANDYLGTPLMVGGATPILLPAMLTVDRFTVDKHDYVGILLNGA